MFTSLIKMNAITLPVSYGEALDKLSILDIKLQKITDCRRDDVQAEYDAIYGQLAPLFTHDLTFHYNTLKAINLSIWDMQDTFRECSDLGKKNSLCTKIIADNDRRFRVKHKINHLLNSSLKEQKGYVKTKICFVGHTEIGDMINCIGIVRYLATQYDEVRITVKEKYISNISIFYKDDPTITFYPIPSHLHIYSTDGMDPAILAKATEGYEIAYAGVNVKRLGRTPNTFAYIPFCFYTDVNITNDIFWSYSHYAENADSIALASKLACIPYIFIHTTSSMGIRFTAEDVERRFNLNRDTTLIINPDTNIYPADHPWHSLASEFVLKPVAHYRETIIGAQKIIVTDSCFFCYAIQLPIETTECYYLMRNRHSVNNYNYFFTDHFFFDAHKPAPKRIFNLLNM